MLQKFKFMNKLRALFYPSDTYARQFKYKTQYTWQNERWILCLLDRASSW